ncbi:MAG: hypothetical protein AAF215_25450 [Cyanobacteria bacterium P01_A01_bin.123]
MNVLPSWLKTIATVSPYASLEQAMKTLAHPDPLFSLLGRNPAS